MSIDQLKKRAKNLQKLYPEFSAKHVATPPKLADFQELMARVDGFPSFHAATTRRTQKSEAVRGENWVSMLDFDQIELRLVIAYDTRTFEEYRVDGTPKSPREHLCVFFQPRHLQVHADVTESLDGFLDDSGHVDVDVHEDDAPSPEYDVDMIVHCEALVREEPGFIDGYAHWANALFRLERYQEAIALNQPVLDRLTRMIPPAFKGRIPYSIMHNRPFHRLVHTLVLSYWKLGTPEGDKAALSLAKKMLKWWPNDNIGFRFLLERPIED